jgi:integrase/recombinase XerD
LQIVCKFSKINKGKMAVDTPNLSLFLDKRHSKKEGKYPVKLRITFKRISKYYSTGFDMTEDEFTRQRDVEILRAKKEIGTKEYAQLSKINQALNNQLVEAYKVIDNIKYFSFDTFELKRTDEIIESDSIFDAFNLKIKILKEEGRIGTAITYDNALNSIKEFHKMKVLSLNSVTVKFLKNYEKWMLDSGKSITTVGFYLRNLRAIINELIDSDKTKMEEYPFGPKKYVIPTKKNTKKALSNQDLKKILEYKPEPYSPEEKYMDYWLFMYFGNGMNPVDMVHLKYENMGKDRIVFRREKTKRTNREASEITIFIQEKNLTIIRKWGNPNKPKNYIFPILRDGMTPTEVKKAVLQFVKQINKYIKRIGEKLEIDKHITTYVARHSFITKFLAEGGSLLDAKDLAGHTSITTTEGYVGSIEDDRIKNITNRLSHF